MAQRPNQRRYTDYREHIHKKMFTMIFFIIREWKIITVKYYYTPIRMAQIPKLRTPITGEMQTQEL